MGVKLVQYSAVTIIMYYNSKKKFLFCYNNCLRLIYIMGKLCESNNLELYLRVLDRSPAK